MNFLICYQFTKSVAAKILYKTHMPYDVYNRLRFVFIVKTKILELTVIIVTAAAVATTTSI